MDALQDLTDHVSHLALGTKNIPEATAETEVPTPYPHIFVVGDASNAFGAIQAGHNAHYQV